MQTYMFVVLLLCALVHLSRSEGKPEELSEPEADRKGHCEANSPDFQEGCGSQQAEDLKTTQAHDNNDGATSSSPFSREGFLPDGMNARTANALVENCEQLQSFFKTKDEIDEINEQRSHTHVVPDLGHDGDICCATISTLQPMCGKMKDIRGNEWYVLCPEVNGNVYFQFADTGACVSSVCLAGTGKCRMQVKDVSLYSTATSPPWDPAFRLFSVKSYCTCQSN